MTVEKGNTFIVFRIFADGRKVPVGKLEERRRTERADNRRDILRLAKKLYSTSTFDALKITVEPA